METFDYIVIVIILLLFSFSIILILFNIWRKNRRIILLLVLPFLLYSKQYPYERVLSMGFYTFVQVYTGDIPPAEFIKVYK